MWLDLEEDLAEEFGGLTNAFTIDDGLSVRASEDKHTARLAMGLCPRCGRLPMLGKRSCDRCILNARVKTRAVAKRLNYKLSSGGNPSPSNQARRASGRCVGCHSPSVTRRCERCKEKNREYQRAYLARRYAAGAVVGSRRQRKAA